MGRYIDVQIENTYEYQGHKFDGFDDIANLLNFNLNMARDPKKYETDVKAILEEAQKIAQAFVDENHPVSQYSTYQTTKNLRKSIKYDLKPLNGGTGGRLYADAQDYRGHKYAGHIEYGFTDRMGIPHGPWPFIRPAMRIAAVASQKGFAEKMAEIIRSGFDNDFGSIQFGGRNVENRIQNIGGRAQIAKNIHKSYQDSSKNGSRWHNAYNGIGFRSGVKYGYKANYYTWDAGEL